MASEAQARVIDRRSKSAYSPASAVAERCEGGFNQAGEVSELEAGPKQELHKGLPLPWETMAPKVLLPASREAWSTTRAALRPQAPTWAVTANTAGPQEALGVSVHWHHQCALCSEPQGLACKEEY